MPVSQRRRIPRLIGSLLLVATAGVGCGEATADTGSADGKAAAAEPEVRPLGRIVPVPASVTPEGEPYTLTHATRIGIDESSRESRAVGRYLAGLLRPATGFPLHIVDEAAARDGIRLRLDPGAA